MSRKQKIDTIVSETMIQRIARNIAWYALRVARPGYLGMFTSCPLTYVSITDPKKARDYVHALELMQSSDQQYGDKPPVPLHHVIFRG